MVDEADISNDRIEIESNRSISAIRASAANMPKGNAGTCYRCGEYSLRLVKGECAPCRDKYK